MVISDCIYTRTSLVPELIKSAIKLLPKAAGDFQKGQEVCCLKGID